MATISIYVQLKGGKPPRRIEATSLAWTFGRISTFSVLYSTGGTSISIQTLTHRIESDPAPGTTTVPATAPSSAITVGQEQIAIELPLPDTASVNKSAPQATGAAGSQISPFAYNTSTAVTSATTAQGRNLAAPGHFQQILSQTHFDYVRFTGTELPSGGVMIPRPEIVAMFTATTATTDLQHNHP